MVHRRSSVVVANRRFGARLEQDTYALHTSALCRTKQGDVRGRRARTGPGQHPFLKVSHRLRKRRLTTLRDAYDVLLLA
mgnify:CR=1 FL=1